MGFFSTLLGSILGKNFNHFGIKGLDGSTSFNLKLRPEQKLALVLSNPAVMKVFALQCEMFSLGRIYAYKNDREIEDHPLKALLASPNPFQSQQEFLWEFMFWLMLGESTIYSTSTDINKLIGNMLYNLRPYRIEYPDSLKKSADKILISKASVTEYFSHELVYRYDDGTSFKFKYKDLMRVSDLGTPLNRISSMSRIDSLMKPIQNNEAAMDALNINTRYSGKFAVAGTADPNDVNTLPLTDPEKESIEKKMNDDKPVHAVKSMIDVKRFVENAGAQKLPEAYLHTYFVIGSGYGIPKDVLEAFNSGTYENQEKARGAHVSYSLQPKGDLLMDKVKKHFGYAQEDIKLYMDWTHLPFMQVFAKQEAETKRITIETLHKLQQMGIDINEANKFLDTTFTSYERRQTNTGTQAGS